MIGAKWEKSAGWEIDAALEYPASASLPIPAARVNVPRYDNRTGAHRMYPHPQSHLGVHTRAPVHHSNSLTKDWRRGIIPILHGGKIVG